jgi:hypothetical protein
MRRRCKKLGNVMKKNCKRKDKERNQDSVNYLLNKRRQRERNMRRKSGSVWLPSVRPKNND